MVGNINLDRLLRFYENGRFDNGGINMTLYEIASLVTPPIIMKILHKCFKNEKSERYLKKLQKKNISTIGQIPKQSERLIVIGNGPSLTKSIEKYKNEICKYDCIVVNHFCESDYYKELKPKYYLLADPAFFGKLETYVDWLREKIEGFITSFVSNTTWDINLVVPNFAIGSELIEEIQKNSFIHLYYYNPYDLIQCDLIQCDEKDKFFLWDKNLIAPPAQTVLNTCVYLGIFLKYEEINILGMDMSWHEDLELDQKTNELFIVDKHFYGNKRCLATLDINGIKPARVHEYLECSVNALKSFVELKEFADYNKIKVYNLSPHSWVDAFERKEFK